MWLTWTLVRTLPSLEIHPSLFRSQEVDASMSSKIVFHIVSS
jgi:hypothetical protein